MMVTVTVGLAMNAAAARPRLRAMDQRSAPASALVAKPTIDVTSALTVQTTDVENAETRKPPLTYSRLAAAARPRGPRILRDRRARNASRSAASTTAAIVRAANSSETGGCWTASRNIG